MFKQIIILLAILAITAFAITQKEAFAEYKSAGMFKSGLDGLLKLDNKFKIEYPNVSGNEKAAEKYIDKFSAESINFVKSMTPKDQEIYNNYAKNFADQ